MVRVRFAPSPTGSLHLGSALSAVANRWFADEHGGTMLLRIDDTDAERNVTGGDETIVSELCWLGVGWEDGPLRQSDRADLHAAFARRLEDEGRAARQPDGSLRFDTERRPTLLRADGRPTYHLASVVDDIDLRITHVIRGKDHLPNTALHMALARALGAEPPQFLHHGLILGDDGQKLSKRHGLSSLAELREAGIPPEAVRAYLEELGIPRGDVRLDRARLRRLSIEAIAALPDEELAARARAPVEYVAALRGARDLAEAHEIARTLADPPSVRLPADAHATLERFTELRERGPASLAEEGARAIVRELKAIGGDLRALRLALTGAQRGPELWAVLVALERDEALRRTAAALE